MRILERNRLRWLDVLILGVCVAGFVAVGWLLKTGVDELRAEWRGDGKGVSDGTHGTGHLRGPRGGR